MHKNQLKKNRTRRDKKKVSIGGFKWPMNIKRAGERGEEEDVSSAYCAVFRERRKLN